MARAADERDFSQDVVIRISPPAGSQPATSPHASRPNILSADGSFELGSPDWCDVASESDDLCAGLVIDRTDAAHGACSAQWLIEPEQRATTLRLPLTLTGARQGATCCVSVSLRASRTQALMAAVSTGRSVELNRWNVGPKWRRFHLSFALGGNDRSDPPRLILSAKSDVQAWVLWIDAVKVEVGASPTPYVPSEAAIVGVALGGQAGLFFERQPVTIIAGAQRGSSDVGGSALRWSLTTGLRTIESGSLPVIGPLVRDATIRTAPLPRGWYGLHLTLESASGHAIAEREEAFGVARDLRGQDRAFTLKIPSRGPRSDAVARRLGLSIDDGKGTSRPATTASTSPATVLLEAGKQANARSAAVAVGRIGELTQQFTEGHRDVRWPSAWRELRDRSGRWGPVAVAVNTWLDIVGASRHLRRIRLADSPGTIDVFASPNRTAAVVCIPHHQETDSRGTSLCVRLAIPLGPDAMEAYDAFGGRVPLSGDADRATVDVSGGLIYLSARPTVSRGRFTLQLEEARVAPPTSSASPR
ncbi:MAG: hypothetical protein JXQ73_32375 [Phycisphaerae bacterium]|nr:hypothetical protein [Phycisphaerae bacterium]